MYYISFVRVVVGVMRLAAYLFSHAFSNRLPTEHLSAYIFRAVVASTSQHNQATLVAVNACTIGYSTRPIWFQVLSILTGTVCPIPCCCFFSVFAMKLSRKRPDFVPAYLESYLLSLIELQLEAFSLTSVLTCPSVLIYAMIHCQSLNT